MKTLINFFYGVIIGVANVIPVLSGGTMAVIFNIYDDILYAISWKNFRKNAYFLCTLGAGALVGIFFFSHVMTYLLEHFEMPLNYSFIGLILGGIPMIYKKAHQKKAKPSHYFIFAAAFVIMVLMAVLNQSSVSNKSLAEAGGPGPGLYLWLVAVTAISTVSMILPGISGSLVMFLLGAYTICIEAVASLDFITLFPICLGVLIGGYIGLKSIKSMLRNHPQELYSAILGLIIGSLFSIYPGPPSGINGFICIILLLLFTLVSYIFIRD